MWFKRVSSSCFFKRRHTITGETTFECYWKHTESMDNDQSNFTFAAVAMPFLFHKEDFQRARNEPLISSYYGSWSSFPGS